MFKGFASALIALLASPAPAAAPAEIYGRLPAIEQAALSPLMVLYDLKSGRFLDVADPGDKKLDAISPLKRAGKTPGFITLEQEDHYLSRSATRLQMLQASMAFLERYNPPD